MNTVAGENVSTMHDNQSSQHLSRKNNPNQHRPDYERRNLQNPQVLSNLILHNPLNQFQHDQEDATSSKINVMIMGPKEYEDISSHAKLFVEFQISFKADKNELINEVLNQHQFKKGKF